jgi:hypothetical protein
VDFERLAESADDAPAATNTKALSRWLFPFICTLSIFLSCDIYVSICGMAREQKINGQIERRDG